jgi:hypothetical protein
MAKEQIHVRFPDWLVQTLDGECARTERTRTRVITDALREYLADRTEQPLPRGDTAVGRDLDWHAVELARLRYALEALTSYSDAVPERRAEAKHIAMQALSDQYAPVGRFAASDLHELIASVVREDGESGLTTPPRDGFDLMKAYREAVAAAIETVLAQ